MSPAGQASAEKAVIPFAVRYDLRSEATGRDYRISLFTPPLPAPDPGYPILYLVDANLTFPVAAAMAAAFAMEGRAAIVVGVGYPTEDILELMNLRRRDLTPPVPRDASEAANIEEHGGSEAFLRFLVDELRPQILDHHNVDPTRQALFGHSLGGLFVAATLVTRPETFSTLIASSPTLYWGDRWVFRQLTRMAASGPAEPAPRLLVTVGANEQKLPATMPAGVTTEQMQAMLKEWSMVDNARDFAEQVGAAPGRARAVRFQALDGEDHLTAVATAISRGLAYFLR
jgi:predicted alpha/beta superfamily hydrolase